MHTFERIIETSDKQPAAAARRPERSQPGERPKPGERPEARPRSPEQARAIHESYRQQQPPEARAQAQAYEARLFRQNERAMRDALERAEVHRPDRPGVHSAYDKLQGQLGESCYHYSHGGGVGLVNDLNAELGKHSAVFDSTSPREMASLKTHLSEKKGAAEAAYAKDLRGLVGAQDSHKHDLVVDKLWEMRQAGGREWARAEAILPPSVAGARSPAEMKTALIDESTLRIPADQVEATRAHVVRNAMRNPELYGIDPNASPQEMNMRANMLAMKVRPLADGLTSHDLRVMTRELYRHKFGPA